MLVHKVLDETDNLNRVRLEREVAGVEQDDLGLGQDPGEGLCSGRNEDHVVLAPDGEERGLLVGEVFLELRVDVDVGPVILEERLLDRGVAGSREQGKVEVVGLGRKSLDGLGRLAVFVLETDQRSRQVSW